MARFDIQLDENIKLKAEKASVLLGFNSLAEYVEHLMDENAAQVIADHETMTLKGGVFNEFMLACDKASEPNRALIDAAVFTENQGID